MGGGGIGDGGGENVLAAGKINLTNKTKHLWKSRR